MIRLSLIANDVFSRYDNTPDKCSTCGCVLETPEEREVNKKTKPIAIGHHYRTTDYIMYKGKKICLYCAKRICLKCMKVFPDLKSIKKHKSDVHSYE